MATKKDHRLNGLNPLSYLGVNAAAPSNTAEYSRAPTSNDRKNFDIGARWIDKSQDPPDLWTLVKFEGDVATWINLSAFNTNGTNGQVLIGGGTEALWANITTASGLVIVNEGANTLDLDLSGTIADIFQTDTLFAQPSGGVLEIAGGASITTSGATNVVTIDVDTDVPTTFAADTGTATAAANVITIAGGTSLASSAAGSTVTLNVDTDVPTTFTTDAGAATPTDNEIKILGGLNIETSATGDAITINGLLATFFEPLASDPTDPGNGQVWYNTTTNLFKGSKALGAVVWVTKANFPYTSFSRQEGASGTSSDALCSGTDSSVGVSTLYEVSTDSWSNRSQRNNLVIIGALVGDSYLSAISIGGSPTPGCSPTTATEIYDGAGDSWTDKGTLNLARRFNGAAGTSSDALTFAGRIDNDGCSTLVKTSGTERYDGVGDAWTVKGNLSATRSSVGGTGTGADALCVGGLSGTLLNIVERYDGVGDSWTVKAPLSAARQFPSCSGPAGDALAIGGVVSTGPVVYTVATEEYDGTVWSAGSNLNVARAGSGSCGSSTSDALTCDGESSTSPLATERLEGTPTIVTFTVT